MTSKVDTIENIDELVKRECEQSLVKFIFHAWKVLEPDTKFLYNWHIGYICEHLEAVTGRQIKRLLINIPPRYMKSIMASVCWPVWEWIKNPGERTMCSSYTQPLSTKLSVDRRRLIQSNWYQSNWSDRYQLTTDQNVKTEFENTKRGHMIAVGFDASITGKGAGKIIIDDPHDPKRANSDIYRSRALDIYDKTLSTRLDDKKTGAIVIIMQRLHEEDLTGHALETGAWVHIKIPSIEHERKVYIYLSGKEKIREEGDILWSEREGKNELEIMKRQLGSMGFAGQYQQEPTPIEGGIIKREWFNYYDTLPQCDHYIQSWDLAFKDAKTSSYVTCEVWGLKEANKYLIDVVRAKLDFVATKAEMLNVTNRYPHIIEKLVEDKANGPAIMSELKNTIPGMIAINPRGSKESRAIAVSPQVEAGNVWLPKHAPWLDDFLLEVCSFPNSKYNDQIDTMTQALERLHDIHTKYATVIPISMKKTSNWSKA